MRLLLHLKYAIQLNCFGRKTILVSMKLLFNEIINKERTWHEELLSILGQFYIFDACDISYGCFYKLLYFRSIKDSLEITIQFISLRHLFFYNWKLPLNPLMIIILNMFIFFMVKIGHFNSYGEKFDSNSYLFYAFYYEN